MMFFRNLSCAIGLLILFGGCKKFVEVPAPKDQINSEIAFDNDGTATKAVVGIYSEMNQSAQLFTSGYTTFFAGMAADELKYYTTGYRDEFVNNEISLSTHPYLSSIFWQPAYHFIYSCNLAIEKLPQSRNLSENVRNRLLGEAYFLRAFCYFELVNLFGDVPLVLTTDYRVNSLLTREKSLQVYEQIVKDLLLATTLLPVEYSSGIKSRPNLYAAESLLARTYLYMENWEMAYKYADAVISNGPYHLEGALTNVFQRNSQETIWQLANVNPYINTWEGNGILPALPTTPPTYFLTNRLVSSFEPGDLRKINWIQERIYQGDTLQLPSKYKVYGNGAPISENYIVLRLAELYLIRSEALAHLGMVAEAASDLNTIRERSGLADMNFNNVDQILNQILEERRFEFFTEWGNRWFDLKRTGQANLLLGPYKGATWNSTDQLWPIPADQLLLNPNLTQNEGY